MKLWQFKRKIPSQKPGRGSSKTMSDYIRTWQIIVAESFQIWKRFSFYNAIKSYTTIPSESE